MRTSWSLACFVLLSLAAVAQAQPAEVPHRVDTVRLRSGFDLGIGSGAGGVSQSPTWALAFSAHGRIGVQLVDELAIYYQASGIFGGEVIVWGEGSHGVFMHTSSVVIEATIANMFQIAAGPSLGVGVLGSGLAAGGGMTGRAAITFGGDGVGRRSGFSLGTQLDLVHVPSVDQTMWMVQLTCGAEWF